MSDGKCIVKYLRLSLEDEDMLDESNSITNQRIVIGQYIASKNEFKNTEVLEFKDDGYSGTNFDRPGFQSMMELVRDGKVSTIIVKDLSRFGRNHIEVDTYLEQIFPFMNVRFIAINDSLKSIMKNNKDISYGYKFIDGNVGTSEEGIITLPLYMIAFFDKVSE